MLLSLIIPVYKVEQFIEECLESVCSQLTAATPVEVIVVNDGTPDSSMILARNYITTRYAEFEEKFVFVDQENQGLSSARNTGIRYSKGEYLMFLDSDDIIENIFFEKIIAILKQKDIDIIQFKAYRFHQNAADKMDFIIDSPFEQKQNMSDDVLQFVFNASIWYAWMRIYHKKLFHDQLYPVGKLYEDAYTTPFIFLKAKTAYFINENLLGYRFNEQGITAKITKKSIEDLKDLAMLFVASIPKSKYFSLSLISISQYYISQSLKLEGYIQASKRWSELKKIIKHSSFDEGLLKNQGNKLFFKFGTFFLVLEPLLVKLKAKK